MDMYVVRVCVHGCVCSEGVCMDVYVVRVCVHGCVCSEGVCAWMCM